MDNFELYNNLKNFQRSIFGHKLSKTNWSSIELVSLHIPKTAGTSFFHTLKKQYGQHIIRVDINRELWINKIQANKAYISNNPKVIHGHFTIDMLKKEFDLPSNTPLITWLRDPVERVISNYFYLIEILEGAFIVKGRHINVLNRMKKSLSEFAQDEKNQNRMSKFLAGTKLEDFFFIGFLESYEQDIQMLAQKLNWSKVDTFQHNVTAKKKKPFVDEKTRALIRSYNQKDVELYQKALRLRKLQQ